jgi:hypothetical protein
MEKKHELRYVPVSHSKQASCSCTCGNWSVSAHDQSAKTAEESAKKAFSQHLAEANQAHLVRDGNLQRCSVCGYPFSADVRPSMSVAFAEHLMKAHKPGQND